VAFVQRFDSGLRLTVHFRVLWRFTGSRCSAIQIVPMPPSPICSSSL
jgi:hypothetical protein